MATLQEMLSPVAPQFVADCQTLIDGEVDSKGGLSGTAVKAAYKVVTAFAVPGDLDPADAHSNTFELEWPRGSGQMRTFPEVDRVEWFPVAGARAKLLKGQLALLDQLMADPRMAGLPEG